MSPSDDKSIIKGPTATNLVIDVENDFGVCKGELPEPVIPPNQEILDEGKCAKNERCDYKPNEEKEAVYVYVDLSDFTDISKSDVDGGAIHIVNCGLNCNKTTFTRCSAPKRGGGAIYAKNTLDFANSMTFKDLKFKQCSATYGAGIYAYSSSDQCLVTIDSCKFDSNTIVEDSSSPLIGGSAMYLTVKIGNVVNCDIRGASKYSLIKATKDFTTYSNLRRIDQLSSQNSLLISSCHFKHNDDSTTSIYYVSSMKGAQIEVNRCIFKGKLSNGNHYIDGKLLTKEANKISVNSCTFD